MRKKVSDVLDTNPVVGVTGHHLLVPTAKLVAMSCRSQRAWLRSLQVEVDKEEKRRMELWKINDTQRQMAALRVIHKKGEQFAQWSQQTVTRYFVHKQNNIGE